MSEHGRRDENGAGSGRPRRRDSGARNAGNRRSDGPRGKVGKPRRDDQGARGSEGARGSQGARGDRFDRQGRGGTRRRDQGRPDDRRRGPRPTEQSDDQALARQFLEAPELPEGVEFSDLDAEARGELRTLPKPLAESVGKHLVAAGQLMDEDPEAALAHAKYAKNRASRVPIVREALGLVAYQAGHWSEALSELRAVRRMTRTDDHIAIIADAERAMGRPERALDIAKEANTSALPRAVEIELRIVAAGARRDLGQIDAAVVSLQGDDLDPKKQEPWSARLFYAYADNLEAAGRRDEAIQWFLRAAEADHDEETDAAERASELAEPEDE